MKLLLGITITLLCLSITGCNAILPVIEEEPYYLINDWVFETTNEPIQFRLDLDNTVIKISDFLNEFNVYIINESNTDSIRSRAAGYSGSIIYAIEYFDGDEWRMLKHKEGHALSGPEKSFPQGERTKIESYIMPPTGYDFVFIPGLYRIARYTLKDSIADNITKATMREGDFVEFTLVE